MHLIIQLTTTHIHLPVHYEFYIRFVQFKTATHFFRNSIYEFGISQLGTSSRSYSLLLICISTLKSLALILVFWEKNTRLTKNTTDTHPPRLQRHVPGCTRSKRPMNVWIRQGQTVLWLNLSKFQVEKTYRLSRSIKPRESESYGGAREWLAKIIGREWDWVSTRVFWENETAWTHLRENVWYNYHLTNVFILFVGFLVTNARPSTSG